MPSHDESQRSERLRARPEEVVLMMFWNGGGWAFWQVALMWFLMVGFWGLVIWAIYALVTDDTRRPESELRGGNARQILDARLARGEINAEEYRSLREVLATGGSPTSDGSGIGR
jgi:putative membrane protein